MGNFVLPVVITAILWWAYRYFENMVVRMVCWYGSLVIVFKALVIVFVTLVILPLKMLYSEDIVQMLYPAIAYLAVLYPKRQILKIRTRTVLTSVVGIAILLVVWAYVDFLILFYFHPLF